MKHIHGKCSWGARLFAWLGGLALFCHCFPCKVFFDHDLIAPWLRIALGYLIYGLDGGWNKVAPQELRVTSQTLAATGLWGFIRSLSLLAFMTLPSSIRR